MKAFLEGLRQGQEALGHPLHQGPCLAPPPSAGATATPTGREHLGHLLQDVHFMVHPTFPSLNPKIKLAFLSSRDLLPSKFGVGTEWS